MKQLRVVVLLLALLALSAGAAGGAFAAEVQYITLDEAIAIALEKSPKIKSARLELENARLAFEQTVSQALMSPNPVARLQAEADLDLATRNLALVQNQVRLEVAENFLAVRRLDNLVRVMKDSLALAERQLAIAENRYAVGSAARVEIMRSANQVSNVSNTLLELEGNRNVALMAFRMSLGLELSDPVEPLAEELEPIDVDINVEEDVRFALENRLEILRAQNGVEVARKQVELASNDYTPVIALNRAKVGLQMAEDGLAQAKKGIELEIRQMSEALLANERKLKVLAESIEVARETLEITEEMYKAGVAADVEVLGAQASLTQAQTDYVNTLFDLHTARVRYLHATARALAGESGRVE